MRIFSAKLSPRTRCKRIHELFTNPLKLMKASNHSIRCPTVQMTKRLQETYQQDLKLLTGTR